MTSEVLICYLCLVPGLTKWTASLRPGILGKLAETRGIPVSLYFRDAGKTNPYTPVPWYLGDIESPLPPPHIQCFQKLLTIPETFSIQYLKVGDLMIFLWDCLGKQKAKLLALALQFCNHLGRGWFSKWELSTSSYLRPSTNLQVLSKTPSKPKGCKDWNPWFELPAESKLDCSL